MRFAVTLLLVSSLFAQHEGNGESRWAEASGLDVETVHRLWRSMSHFADERDDDSRIALLDSRSLAARNQLLMVTAAGLPTCLTVAVFSNTLKSPKALWSESSSPDGKGFCEAFGIQPEVNVSNGKILIKAPVGMHSEHASHADVAEYTYAWTGQTYTFGYTVMTLKFVAPADRPNNTTVR